MASVRFLYDGERIQAHHTPAEVCHVNCQTVKEYCNVWKDERSMEWMDIQADGQRMELM